MLPLAEASISECGQIGHPGARAVCASESGGEFPPSRCRRTDLALLQLGALQYPFPGWETMQHLFDHLNKLTTTEGSKAAAPLRSFLKKAGYDVPDSRGGGARGVKRAQGGWVVVQVTYEASQRQVV